MLQKAKDQFPLEIFVRARIYNPRADFFIRLLNVTAFSLPAFINYFSEFILLRFIKRLNEIYSLEQLMIARDYKHNRNTQRPPTSQTKVNICPLGVQKF